ncbi:glycosyl hydrolase family 18 protein, partial [Streptomyces griseus]
MFKPHRPRARLRALAAAACTAALGATLLGVAGTSPAGATPVAQPAAAPAAAEAAPTAAGDKVIGYFTNWGTYDRNYHVKNIETSGSADKLTHINYAFGNVTGGKCTVGDAYADYEKAYTADQSVDGVADTWDQPLRGNFNQ